MFKGRRDPEVRIIVEQNKCNSYTSKTGGSWIEVSIPPEDTAEYGTKWATIMVDKKQIDNLNTYGALNCIRVNDDADIVCSLKNEKRVVIASETLKPVQIIGRFLKYYRWAEYEARHPELAEELNRPSLDLYNDMVTLGQDMLAYMNRLPKTLPAIYTSEAFAPIPDPMNSFGMAENDETIRINESNE